jgi:purine-binding chemotaxis protein CheW
MSNTTFLKFSLGEAAFGLPVAQVEETIRVVALTSVPSQVPGLLGVVDVRGRVIPVFDLVETLGQARRPLSLRMYIVIASLGADAVGLLVDDVLDVIDVPGGQFQLEGALGGGESYIAGVARVGDDMLTILSLAPLVGPAAASRAAVRDEP